MLIRVTKKHIKQGVISDPYSCPVALAIRDKGFECVVTEHTIRTNNIWAYKRYNCPRSVSRFVKAFDKGRKVKPFSFILREV